MADGAGMAGAPLDVSGRKPGAAGGIHAVDSDAAVVVDAVNAAQGVRVVDSSGLIRILPVEAGQTLARTIWLSGELPPPALCSGLGRCGACRVRFLEGTPEPRTQRGRGQFAGQPDRLGKRLPRFHRKDVVEAG